MLILSYTRQVESSNRMRSQLLKQVTIFQVAVVTRERGVTPDEHKGIRWVGLGYETRLVRRSLRS